MMSKEQMSKMFKGDGFLEEFYGKGGIKYFGERYRLLFQKLLVMKDTTAMLYHCTGGRDRTGMATALSCTRSAFRGKRSMKISPPQAFTCAR